VYGEGLSDVRRCYYIKSAHPFSHPYFHLCRSVGLLIPRYSPMAFYPHQCPQSLRHLSGQHFLNPWPGCLRHQIVYALYRSLAVKRHHIAPLPRHSDLHFNSVSYYGHRAQVSAVDSRRASCPSHPFGCRPSTLPPPPPSVLQSSPLAFPAPIEGLDIDRVKEWDKCSRIDERAAGAARTVAQYLGTMATIADTETLGVSLAWHTCNKIALDSQGVIQRIHGLTLRAPRSWIEEWLARQMGKRPRVLMWVKGMMECTPRGSITVKTLRISRKNSRGHVLHWMPTGQKILCPQTGFFTGANVPEYVSICTGICKG